MALKLEWSITKLCDRADLRAQGRLLLQIHRIPVVDNSAKLVGIVTRTDIFTALENEQGSVNVKMQL